MPSLSQLKTEGNLKILLMGDAGVGKTVFACGFPGRTKLLDFDLKADSAALFYRKETERLERIDVEQFNPIVDKISPMEKLNSLIQKWMVQERTGKMEFDNLVLDSITTFSAAALRHIVATNPGIKRTESAQGKQPGLQDYGILKREFEKLINGLVGLPCNVIMLAHIATEKDELTGQMLRHTMMDGSFAKQLPIYFKEVWRAFVKDGKRFAQTQSDHQYNCRSQIPGLPNPLPLNYTELAKYL